jgi:uncharacterized protein
MAAGLPDLVDCARLAGDAAVIERAYDLSELPRLQDLLAESGGRLSARFVFSKAASGRAAASIAIRATPQLICQRCMQGFAFPVSGGSEIEFSDDEEAAGSSMERELYEMHGGRVSLRELAEEELLLALPLAPACSAPQDCGHAPTLVADVDAPEPAGEMRRPFSALQDLLKKT